MRELSFEAGWEMHDRFSSFTSPELYVMSWNTDTLAEACKRIAAVLDQEALETAREANKILKEKRKTGKSLKELLSDW